MSLNQKKSGINWGIAVVFLVFAVIQWNDPDPILWILIYGCIAICVVLYQLGYQMRLPFAVASIVFLVYGLYLFPSMLRWIQAGMPSLAGEMQAETPEIESMRELGGVLIVFTTSLIYWWKSRD